MFDNKVVFHVDVNSAFLSWEAVYRLKHTDKELDLRTIPSAVGGDVAKRRGIILAKSVPAKKYGIKTGETINEALCKCPTLMVVSPNRDIYEQASAAFMNILREYTPVIEQYSIDEAFMDMTGTEKLYGDPVALAESIRNRIREELGFTVNIGVSTNKLLAKMAGDLKKPDMVHTIFPHEIESKMWRLPVSELFFVGRATTAKLFSLGIRTIGDLAATDPVLLKYHLKKQGELIYQFAHGIDVSVVEQAEHVNKGYGNSTTIAFDVTDTGTAKMVLLALAETVGSRLRRDGKKAGVVSVGIKDYTLHHSSHERTLVSPTNITEEIHRIACELFDEAWDGTAIRHLGIHTGRLSDMTASRQLELFDDTDYEKLERLDNTIDDIRQRFGVDAVKRAVFVKNKENIHKKD